ncbi:MAG: hypothetical protein QXZ25_04745 [Candidatus Bathyarchaeia archaeon]
MGHITIEYMIMIPLLILQIFLFPLTASWLMNIWVDSRRTLALQEVASHLGSTIQQIYFLLNHTSIPVGTSLTQKSDLPLYVENYPYIATATLKDVAGAESSKVLEITLKLRNIGTSVTTSTVLGKNVQWQESTFVSNSTSACINARKEDGEIILSFGG